MLSSHDSFGHRTDWVEFHPAWHQLGFGERPEFALWRQKTLQADCDLRQTQTTAVVLGPAQGEQVYAITGHKWFRSVPVADGFFTLAQTHSGIRCLFVPRVLPDGSHHRFEIQRLSDKCGNRSNASSEIGYRDTWALLVGDEG